MRNIIKAKCPACWHEFEIAFDGVTGIYPTEEGDRIAAKLESLFPNHEDVIGSSADGAVIRNFSLGYAIRHRENKSIDDACRLIADEVIRLAGVSFGDTPNSQKLYWRERPIFSTWADGDTRSQRVAVWFALAIEGMGDYAPYRGRVESFFRTEVGELGRCSYINPQGVTS